MRFLASGMRLLLALCLLLSMGLATACNRSDNAGSGDETEVGDSGSDSKEDRDSKMPLHATSMRAVAHIFIIFPMLQE